MKTLQNNFTTPEQSKRLLELGVPEDSADCYLFKFRCGDVYTKWHITLFENKETFSGKMNLLSGIKYDYLPCWSVGRLIKILKICITDKNELHEIFDELEICVDETAALVQTFKEFSDVIDFLKVED